MNESRQTGNYQIHVLQTREEVIDYLIRNKAYPYCSKTGKIFFRRLKKTEDENTNFEGIIKDGTVEKLGLQTEEDCRSLREKIKEELSKKRKYKPTIKEAIKESAAAVIFVHNHPSGEPQPSEEDIEITNRLVQACDLVGIRALDHVIIGGDGYMSFVDAGLMKER
jgi:proteasome lid subunit RPN8/RPN11